MFRKYLFPLVIGPVDGILTTLTLAAGHIVASSQPVDFPLAARVAAAAALSGGFVFFVAEYARLRADLVHAERHLNLSRPGQLAASRLGTEVLREALAGTLVAAAAGFAGAMLPLALGAVFPMIRWTTIAVAIAALGLLGIAVSRATHGNPLYWAASLMITGALLTVAGMLLHLT